MNLLKVTTQALCKTAEDEAKKLSVKTHQIRNFYSSAEKLRIKWQKAKLQVVGGQMSASELSRELLLIKPKLAYAAARHKDLQNFYRFISGVIKDTTEELDKQEALDAKDAKKNVQKIFDNFIILMESIVAYHKYSETQKERS